MRLGGFHALAQQEQHGAANPRTAAARMVVIARELGLRGLKVAAVTGDDVLDIVRAGDVPLIDRERAAATWETRSSPPTLTSISRG